MHHLYGLMSNRKGLSANGSGAVGEGSQQSRKGHGVFRLPAQHSFPIPPEPPSIYHHKLRTTSGPPMKQPRWQLYLMVQPRMHMSHSHPSSACSRSTTPLIPSFRKIPAYGQADKQPESIYTNSFITSHFSRELLAILVISCISPPSLIKLPFTPHHMSKQHIHMPHQSPHCALVKLPSVIRPPNSAPHIGPSYKLPTAHCEERNWPQSLTTPSPPPRLHTKPTSKPHSKPPRHRPRTCN